MKVAYLIAAHNQPQHLARLVKALVTDWAYVFIHIDAKSNITQFQSLIPENDHIFFLKGNQRVKVYWGGFSQVLATLNLLQAASSCGQDFTRYCLLSGSDFPIKNNERIQVEFSSQKEFIRVDRKLDYSNQHKQSRNIKYFYFRDQPQYRGNWFSGIVPRPRQQFNIYHGASWWSLTKKCIDYILAFLNQNPHYLEFYRYTNSSDETLFHSIVKQSPFREQITHDFEKIGASKLVNSKIHGCHYVQWAEGAKSPKVLVAEDLSSLMSSEALFARKFDQAMSQELLDSIEQEALSSKAVVN